MLLPLYQVDAFADRPFAGNPAAVCLLAQWLPDGVLHSIAAENNLSETAYLVPGVPASGAPPTWQIRWFTPTTEVALCGHATLASAHVLFDALGLNSDSVVFQTRQSGTLTVRRDGGKLEMDFPAWPRSECPADPAVSSALGAEPETLYHGTDWMAVFATRAQVAGLAPDMAGLARLPTRGIICTAPADPELDGNAHFVSRMFAPASGIPEDPVTGSAHCMLTPYWTQRLERPSLVGRQISPRGGRIGCRMGRDRVYLSGTCALYLTGTIRV
ncbi:MAG: PhzF family phenazine biosynthesis protein [Rhodospirillaceae bacterium]|nr:PhzF family phenazine biosynthesis protein [Rhodospirillaceae bacterium]